MAEARLIFKKITYDRVVRQLSEFGQLLYVYMIIHSDDYGRLPGTPEEIKAIIMPFSLRNPEDFKKELENMEKTKDKIKPIIRWEKGYAIEIINFGKYQKAYHRRKMTEYLFSNEYVENGLLIERSDKGQGKVDERSGTNININRNININIKKNINDEQKELVTFYYKSFILKFNKISEENFNKMTDKDLKMNKELLKPKILIQDIMALKRIRNKFDIEKIKKAMVKFLNVEDKFLIDNCYRLVCFEKWVEKEYFKFRIGKGG